MTVPARHLRLLARLSLVLIGCRSAQPVLSPVQPPPPIPVASVTSRWLALQSTVNGWILESRMGAADSALLQFVRENPRTPEGDRARWWRALVRADGRTEATASLAQIDSLLTNTAISLDVRTEVLMIRRILTVVDSERRGELRRRVQATQLAGDRLEELRITRDSVAKLNAEITRLRRRLSAP